MNLQFLYNNNFNITSMDANPLEATSARDWQDILARYDSCDWECLRDAFIELSFPVREGISDTAEFSDAVKRGKKPIFSTDRWIPKVPHDVSIFLYETPVGRLPIIIAKNDDDFIRLLQSLAYRCEPHPIPDSRGAGIIKNYNNWMRISMLRERFEKEHPTGDWSVRFSEIRKQPELYRDYIILLSNRYYSGIPPESFGLDEADWRDKSLIIRREHEISHYMTARYYQSAKNEIHDEIIADFMGLTAAFGHYDSTMFLTFLGLEDPNGYRSGGRLENYLGSIPAKGEDFNELCKIIRQAAINIERVYKSFNGGPMEMFHILCRISVADMARNLAYYLRV